MKTLFAILGALLAVLVVIALAVFLVLRIALTPLPGEWALPLAIGPLKLQAGVPSALRLATSWWGAPLLDGRALPVAQGRLHIQHAGDGELQVRCAPCTLQPPGLGQEPLVLPEVQFTVSRLADLLSGEVRSGAVHGRWQGQLSPQGLRLQLRIPSTPLADGFALFAGVIPEVGRARIGGSFSLDATWSLPQSTLTVTPRIEGFEVAGLGTEALVGARSACSRRASRLTADSWLARAVVAAEDQRFWDHTGYDLAELTASLVRNNEAQRIQRGASTLSQQVARLLVTGDERSPVRKLRELLYAVELDRTLGKPRLLHMYLDHAPWGEGLCGAESASLRYFGVRAHELGPAQAAWLAAMLHNPGFEAQRWAGRGGIDTARAQWVLLAMRGMPRAKKLALAEQLPMLDWTPRWAEPGTSDGGKAARP
ncbi:biosynthetic peptidoglycan transglycosylase [Ramlibacter humi]|uniref:Glycosyl transferase n=1 Tax=Ramlibacter humi TaxID=2530451 RepID=A0A4Z0BV86_9BURK|nr:biosynthetic peptidoglycan transglycosylase [Ramlibacter humi]TFZ01899.1 glycosyl transferase [Ramlibacter humi]